MAQHRVVQSSKASVPARIRVMTENLLIKIDIKTPRNMTRAAQTQRWHPCGKRKWCCLYGSDGKHLTRYMAFAFTHTHTRRRYLPRWGTRSRLGTTSNGERPFFPMTKLHFCGRKNFLTRITATGERALLCQREKGIWLVEVGWKPEWASSIEKLTVTEIQFFSN